MFDPLVGLHTIRSTGMGEATDTEIAGHALLSLLRTCHAAVIAVQISRDVTDAMADASGECDAKLVELFSIVQNALDLSL